MTINRQVKSTLAKLLATENLTVEHSNVRTASFDVQNRVLSLPIWENVSDDVYDLLVGHEVGHAIYTPNKWGDDYGVPQSYLNVVEDARIERLMKVKYPGLSKSFYRGYSELNSEDFFEIEDIQLNNLSLIDRINLYFKIGIHDVSTLIPFIEEESKFIKLIKEAETFNDVVDICQKLVEYVKNQQKEQQKVDITPLDANQQGSGSSDSIEIEMDKSEESNNDKSDKSEETEESNDSLNNRETTDSDNFMDLNDAFGQSSTDDAWQRNQEKFVSSGKKNYLYITPPRVDWENHIINLEEFSSDMDLIIDKLSKKTKIDWAGNVTNYGCNLLSEWKTEYNNFKNESNKSVSFLIKEFEMKKKADEYNRSSVSKTGVLDTNKLFSYKWSDDIFKKTSVIPTGKNHGLIMYIDWSGSMQDNLQGTIRQLINLIMFCKKTQIPYQVFAFIDNNSTYFDSFVKRDVHHEISVMSKYRLIEMFNSSLNTQELEKQIIRVWNLVKCITQSYSGDIFEHSKYGLGSTPLNDSIFAGIYLHNKFKKRFKVEKLNTVFLTDGESNSLYVTEKKIDQRTGEEYYRHKSIMYYYDTVICFRDPKTGYMDHDINFSTGWNESQYAVTTRLIEYYKWMTGSTVVGFRLSNNGSSIISAVKNREDATVLQKSWKNNKFFATQSLGYDELYVIQINNDYMGKVSEINADHTSTANKLRNEFRKHVKSKMFNKIILSKFVDQIA
jgi:hypothetical protein